MLQYVAAFIIGAAAAHYIQPFWLAMLIAIITVNIGHLLGVL